jgi:hypothetical protein
LGQLPVAIHATVRGTPGVPADPSQFLGADILGRALRAVRAVARIHSGDCRLTLKGHQAPVRSVAVSSDGGTVVSGALDHTVRVWNARSGACLDADSSDDARGALAAQHLCPVESRHLVNHYRDDSRQPAFVRPLIAFGPFDQAYGLLAGDRIVAFTASGEAHWFTLRRRGASG